MPFLTDLDSRARIKGSRDPLGLVPLWASFGRRVVGNLTTVTTGVRDFTTLLLGLYFAQLVEDREGTDHESRLNLFLKFEQLAAYCRFSAGKDRGFRGIERVAARLDEKPKVVLSAALEHQILSNQRTYGLWGLFSEAARNSGLLEEHDLTAPAREVVEGEYLRRLNDAGFKGGKTILDLLRPRRTEIDLAGRHKAIAQALAGLLSPRYSATERAFYREHLVLGGPNDSTNGFQQQLASILDELPPASPFDRTEFRACMKLAHTRGHEELAAILEDIERLESLIAPSSYLFGFLIGRDRQRLGDTAAEVARTWKKALSGLDLDGLRALRERVAAITGSTTAADRWIRIAEHLTGADYESALALLIEHNGAVMQSRGGAAPWVRVEKGRLDVRLQDEPRALPSRDDVPHLWESTYFLNALKLISVPLRGDSPRTLAA